MMRRETLFLDQDSQLFPHIETVIKTGCNKNKRYTLNNGEG